MSAAAPWSASFRSDLSHMSSPEFVLATLAASPAGSTGWAPRARYCIYRGMWAALPANARNAAPRNPDAWASDLPTFTTDARMAKAEQLLASGGATDAAQQAARSGSGGGGPVEAVWWVKEGGVMAQWRVRGTAWLLGPDAEHGGRARDAVAARMRPGPERGDWSWAAEITAHFGNMSPVMRAMFKAPEPGSRKVGEADAEHAPGNRVEDLHDKEARANFRVAVILPEEVERVDLKDQQNPRRVLYSLKDGTWSETEMWP